MSRFAAIALLVALVATGCASADPTSEVSAADAPAEPSGVVPTIELVSGRDALAAAEGTPHVLWFWAPS